MHSLDVANGTALMFPLALAAFVAVLSLAHSTVEKRGAPIVMGDAGTYGVIAATTLTSTGNTKITGNCGTSPGTSVTGFPPGTCTSLSAGGTSAKNAEAACLTAYTNARAYTNAVPPPYALAASDLGGQALGPGAYTFPTSAVKLTGTLTLDGTSNPSGQFIFLITATFDAMASSQVNLINAQACNVYFIVGSSATWREQPWDILCSKCGCYAN
ncbi:FG-GAP repeat protein [Cordyceps militaris CM01]|uniref:FG-GAP repeat protein n=1 Tax=Cordyceps militaris (strain CM01) TaxID=983644 RepID=G3J3W8_CORMM|nr:FG-GAP repeat protein [Cordyceps militaris CM01]EGX95743.1 FG-GAP repeat protein [Cordyceps militaris CM01]